MEKIIIVEDDLFLREELENILIKEGYFVKSISSFDRVVEDIEEEIPGLILLDINLPGISGFEITKRLNSKGIGPILILTSRADLDDELKALNLGADDYITKPSHPERLVARIKKLFSIYSNMKNITKVDNLQIENDTNILYYKEKSVQLTENESIILKKLIKKFPSVLSRKELFNILWGGSEFVDDNILQVNITRLRKTLSQLGLRNIVETVRGKGYILNPGEDDEK